MNHSFGYRHLQKKTRRIEAHFGTLEKRIYKYMGVVEGCGRLEVSFVESSEWNGAWLDISELVVQMEKGQRIWTYISTLTDQLYFLLLHIIPLSMDALKVSVADSTVYTGRKRRLVINKWWRDWSWKLRRLVPSWLVNEIEWRKQCIKWRKCRIFPFWKDKKTKQILICNYMLSMSTL